MSTTQVEQIKDRLSIVDVISSYIKVEKSGINFKARCPFHNEKSPSFFVSPTRRSYHCFGCNKGGDIFSFVEEIEGVSFVEALRILADKAGVKLEDFKSGFDPKDVLYKIMDSAAKFYEENLAKNKPALEYLHKRGLTDETIKEFRIGFAPIGWQNILHFL